jgi:hypothetical protein
MFLFSQNQKLEVYKIEFKVASEFVRKYHRHCKPSIGHLFSLGCFLEGRLVGVAVCGRPVGRRLDDGTTIEINRLATDGTRNACSKLYGFAAKYAKRRGFRRVITYTLVTETSASVRAANFVLEAENVGGLAWTSKRSKSNPSGGIVSAPCLKNRWVYFIS